MAIPEVVEWLRPPFEILELADGESVTIRVREWELGRMVIVPRWPGAPPEKEVVGLRMHLFPGYKAYFPYYYDVTARRLVAQLVTILTRPDFRDYEITITKRGVAPKAWFEVSLAPVG